MSPDTTNIPSVLADIAVGIRAGWYRNEEEVRTKIVLRVLRANGWNTDGHQCRLESTADGVNKRADIVLYGNSLSVASCVIEVKNLRLVAMCPSNKHRLQLEGYAIRERSGIAILTDGTWWHAWEVAGQTLQKSPSLSACIELNIDEVSCLINRFLSLGRQIPVDVPPFAKSANRVRLTGTFICNHGDIRKKVALPPEKRKPARLLRTLKQNPYKWTESEFWQAADPGCDPDKRNLRRNPLIKTYGYGIHIGECGKIAVYGCDEDTFWELRESGTVAQKASFRTSKT